LRDGNVGAPSGDVDNHYDTDAASFAGGAETTKTTSATTRRRVQKRYSQKKGKEKVVTQGAGTLKGEW
jgi:hypothetical protein